ncbi:MAG: DUF4276 family protein [Candidatus Thiodiazotropha taylori]
MSYKSPIGYIVEGHGEYNCYPSLLSRIVESTGFKIPRVNAGGCGNVIRNLDEQLSDLLLVESPHTVIITVDLIDAIRQNLAENMDELVQILSEQIDKWLNNAQDNERLHPLPRNIIIVIQVVKFESWLISDIEGLIKEGLVAKTTDTIDDSEAISSPDKWLTSNLSISGDIKNPDIAKTIVSALDPNIMRLHSKSFDRFFRKSTSAYNSWLKQLTPY